MRHDFIVVGDDATCKRCGYSQHAHHPAPNNCPGDLLNQRKADRRERIAVRLFCQLQDECRNDGRYWDEHCMEGRFKEAVRMADRMIEELDKPAKDSCASQTQLPEQ